jgi:predicted Ser/Thr protein kinase
VHTCARRCAVLPPIGSRTAGREAPILMIGRTIGKYRVVEQIGRGGAGIVYRAVDETLNRDVAIKALNPDLADTDIIKRFRAEATTLARLNHPQIATIYELFRADADLLMVMEFVPGETLEKMAERLAPLPVDRAVHLTDQILSALEHAHRAGVVHRDMKPANVMVTAEGGVKIMDFGIARVRGAEQMTVDGRMMGTPAYMPPEQVLGEEVDGRADLYSVGVVFYRLLTGALPFKADTAVAMLQRQIAEEPIPLEAFRGNLPPWCELVIQRALAKTPSDRFQTAEEFRDAIAGGFGTSAENLAGADTAITPRTEPLENVVTWGNAALVALAVSAALVAYVAVARPAIDDVAGEEPARAAALEEPAARAAGPRRSAEAKSRPSTTATRRAASPRLSDEAPLVFDAKALVGSKKPRERDAKLLLADGEITVTADDGARQVLYSVPYASVVSISYARGPHPMWNSPRGPAPVARAGGTLGRLGIFLERDWVALRTSTKDQFVSLRFDDVVVRRVLVALEERTGRPPQVIVVDPDTSR